MNCKESRSPPSNTRRGRGSGSQKGANLTMATITAHSWALFPGNLEKKRKKKRKEKINIP